MSLLQDCCEKTVQDYAKNNNTLIHRQAKLVCGCNRILTPYEIKSSTNFTADGKMVHTVAVTWHEKAHE